MTTTENILRPRQTFSWSYSRINNFETCPRRYNEIDVLKNFKEEQSEELATGFAVHDALAKRIKDGTPLPANMPFEHWVKYVTREGGKILVEQKLAIAESFKPCEYFSKSPPVWLRTVADALRLDGDLAHIVDWKTGKVKPDMMQLMLIATCVMAHYPKVFRVKAELVWLAYDTKTTEEFTVDDIVKFWGDRMFDKVNKLKTAHDTNNFPPKQSGLCRNYCPVITCEHCGA